jgi:elongation factor Ts
MTITAGDIIKLRTATGAGMMDCKNALEEAGGDADKAVELLRKRGIVKAAKRADKIAAEGRVTSFVSADNKVGAMVEVNSETDFVAKSDDFSAFAGTVAQAIVEKNPIDVVALSSMVLSAGKTVADTVSELTIKIGEKINIRRFVRYESGVVVSYLHGAKIGVLVKMEGGDKSLGMDVAMQIAAANPKSVDRDGVDATLIEKEREIFAEQLRQQGKPDNIIENILKGKMDKFYGEVCLLEQSFIKNEDITIKQLVEQKGAKIIAFTRYELGEGIEKKETDFCAEVAEQIK